jgi:hypothetical protein
MRLTERRIEGREDRRDAVRRHALLNIDMEFLPGRQIRN